MTKSNLKHNQFERVNTAHAIYHQPKPINQESLQPDMMDQWTADPSQAAPTLSLSHPHTPTQVCYSKKQNRVNHSTIIANVGHQIEWLKVQHHKASTTCDVPKIIKEF